MNEIDKNRFIRDIEQDGFTVHREAFDSETIRELNDYAATLGPERGTDKLQKWYGWNTVSELNDPLNDVDWGYYWTQQVYHPIVEDIKDKLSPCADVALGEHNWGWYVQDFIVLHPGMNFTRPHIDTPYRFKEFRYSEKLEGLQFMVMLCDFNEWNGATGYVPGTHKYFYDPEDMASSQSWKTFFGDNYQQYTAPRGSFVSWHPRLLHSTMPNHTTEIRRALLLHASKHDVAKKLRVIDPQHNLSIRKN